MTRTHKAVGMVVAVMLLGCTGGGINRPDGGVNRDSGKGSGTEQDPFTGRTEEKWCDAVGAYGKDKDTGVLLLCYRDGGDRQPRWHRA